MEFAETKDKLPSETDLNCPICFENIDLDELDKYGVPNCVICENGHRIHNKCFNLTENHNCPVCRNKHISFCKSYKGYSYVPRKGGKTKKKTMNKRKKTMNKRKKTMNKRKKTMNKRKKRK